MTALAQTMDFGSWNETLRLQRLEVYNWGPFARHHVAEIDPAGTSIIGPTGSGKTTLVDALMTLIVALPKYNLASTGGHDSDRDLMSYVRGVVGHGNDSGDAGHITRPGRTVTGLAATFGRPGRRVTLGAVLWTDGTSMSAADCRKRWLIADTTGVGTDGTDDIGGLEQWLTLHHEGGDRALKKFCRQWPEMHIDESKKRYLARVRNLFDIGQNAFDLLNRAAGLKQLDSVDQIFRELVLDDHSRFRRAAEVVAEFDQLVGIRAELETARRQQWSLEPLVALHERYQAVAADEARDQRLKTLTARYFAAAGAAVTGDLVAELDEALAKLEVQGAEAADRVETSEQEVEAKRLTYLELGGADLDGLDEQIAAAEELLSVRRRAFDELVDIVARLGLDIDTSDEPRSPDGGFEPSRRYLARVQSAAVEMEAGLAARAAEQAARFQQAAAALGVAEDERRRVAEELARLSERPNSNLPVEYQDFRSELATSLGLDDDDLPFVAELVSVRDDQQPWRGAIERAIGGHRFRILVPHDRLDKALRLVNDRNNRLHVRLERAAADDEVEGRVGGRGGPGAGGRSTRAGRVVAFDDSFLHKLELKEHRLQGALWRLLVSIDRHCVDTPEELRTVSHGMTIKGLLSGRPGRYDKHDRHRLDQGWVTGFDNKTRQAELETRLARLDDELPAIRRAYEVEQQANLGFTQGARLLEAVADYRFDRIDVTSRRSALDTLVARRRNLADPGSRTTRARVALDEARAALDGARKDERTVLAQVAAVTQDRRRAQQRRERYKARSRPALSDDEQALADGHLPALDTMTADSVDDAERETLTALDAALVRHGEELSGLLVALTQQMGRAQKEDTGELLEVGTELEDVPTYLERLRVLSTEALPARRQRFIEYLNMSSDQGVASLLGTIQADVDGIVARIEELNRTLHKVDFQPSRFLRLEPRPVVHQALKDLERARKGLAAARLGDGDGEAQYRALTHVVDLLREAAENRERKSARALLDPRYRLTFRVAVVDRVGGETIEVRSSSEGGSGGEKEIIASYILTASLSYALSPAGSPSPLFGTVVLDEAFSKSSQTVAARIIDALNVFGLHPLFVTPNKELSLLRANTRSAILVNRRGRQARLTALTWEELDRRREDSGFSAAPASRVAGGRSAQ